MVAAEHGALDLEQVLRVAHVLDHGLGHRGLGLHDPREGLHPRLQDGILGIPLVDRDSAVVGINRGLHRVADVVDVLTHLVGTVVRQLSEGVGGRITK